MKRMLIKKNKKKRKGFTLIELLAVILILGIIALIAIPTVNSVIEQSKIGSNESTANNIVTAAEEQCALAQLNGEKLEGTYDFSNLEGLVKGNTDLQGYYSVDSSCKVEIVMVPDNLSNYCYKKKSDEDKISYYEMKDGESCLLEQKPITDISCFTYIEDSGEITITGYKCGGIITDWSSLSIDNYSKGTVEINSFDEGSAMDVVIPSQINGKKVTKIADSAFSNVEIVAPSETPDNSGIKIVPDKNVIIYSLVIPNTVKEIGMAAFAFNKINNLTLQKGLEKVGIGAFLYNDLENLYIPNSVLEVGENAFTFNNIKKLILSNTLKTIGKNSFASNKIEGTITIPDSVERIDEGAFLFNSITDVLLGNGIKTIEAGIFSNNKITGKIVIPDSVTSIGDSAFVNNNIIEVVLGKNVKTVGNNAFLHNNIKKLTLNDSLETIGISAFAYNSIIGTLVIPNSVKRVDDGAFYQNRIEKAIIGSSVTYLGSSSLKDGDTGEEASILATIVNNTGKKFNWDYVMYGWEGTEHIFETGIIYATTVTK